MWEIKPFSALKVWVVYLPILQQFLLLAMSNDVNYLLRTLDSHPISLVTIDDVPSGVIHIQEALNFASII